MITANLLPENAIVSDESGTSGGSFFRYTAAASFHDWLIITGGSIGQGLPVAVGAAVAHPSRKVVSLQADGSGMYTLQALWTLAREILDLLVIILKNYSYDILNIQLDRVGVKNPGEKALSLLDLSNPIIDWLALAQGMGVRAHAASTTDEFSNYLQEALNSKGPCLIEILLP